MTYNQELFSQASTQVNLLLLSQRNMILISAFGITLQSFSSNFKYNYIKYLAILLFLFAIAFGVKSVQDFNKYIEDTKNGSDVADPSEKELLDSWSSWSNYSYFLLAIVSFIFINILIIEFYEIKNYGWFWEKNKKLKKSKK